MSSLLATGASAPAPDRVAASILRACSSAGQSAPLIRVKSAVQIRPGPPNRVFTESSLRRGRSSAGRAPALQAGGQEFDPPRLHQPPGASTCKHRPCCGVCMWAASPWLFDNSFDEAKHLSWRIPPTGWCQRGVLTQEQRKVRLKRCSLRRHASRAMAGLQGCPSRGIPATSFTAVARASAHAGWVIWSSE